VFKERPDERAQECAFDAQKSKAVVRSVVEGWLSQAGAADLVNTTPRRLPNGSSGSAQKVWRDCVIDPPGSFHRQAKPRSPHVTAIGADGPRTDACTGANNPHPWEDTRANGTLVRDSKL
jgi:hypothetical protein